MNLAGPATPCRCARRSRSPGSRRSRSARPRRRRSAPACARCPRRACSRHAPRSPSTRDRSGSPRAPTRSRASRRAHRCTSRVGDQRTRRAGRCAASDPDAGRCNDGDADREPPAGRLTASLNRFQSRSISTVRALVAPTSAPRARSRARAARARRGPVRPLPQRIAASISSSPSPRVSCGAAGLVRHRLPLAVAGLRRRTAPLEAVRVGQLERAPAAVDDEAAHRTGRSPRSSR